MAIVRIYDGAGSEKMVGVGSLPAIETARSGSTSGWTTIDRSRNGEYYTYVRSTVMSNGDDLTIEGSGIDLNSTGSEYVSMFVGETSEGLALFVTGTPAKQLPSGLHNYSGYAVLIDSTAAIVEGGTFGMNVNFETSTGSITGASDNYIFSDNNIIINSINGEFSGSSTTIGPRDNIKVPATLAGSFYGTNANGVGGVVSTDLNQDDGYVAVFRTD